MMLSMEEESPPTPQEKEYIKYILEKIKGDMDPTTKLVLEPLLDKMNRALKSNTLEIEFTPADEWHIKTSRLKHKKTGREISVSMWSDVLEKTFFKYKIHFEFYETSAPKYIVFFKIFNETFGRRPEDIEKILAQVNQTSKDKKSKKIKKDKEKEKEKEKEKQLSKNSDSQVSKGLKRKELKIRKDRSLDDSEDDSSLRRHERQLRKRESNLSASTSSRT